MEQTSQELLMVSPIVVTKMKHFFMQRQTARKSLYTDFCWWVQILCALYEQWLDLYSSIKVGQTQVGLKENNRNLINAINLTFSSLDGQRFGPDYVLARLDPYSSNEPYFFSTVEPLCHYANSFVKLNTHYLPSSGSVLLLQLNL